MTYLDHLLRMNTVLCDALFHKDCPRPEGGPATRKGCKKKFDALSRMMERNARIRVKKSWSDACLDSLKKFPPRECVKAVSVSVTGRCARK